MNDRMDHWLARLPVDGPAPDLAARINLAIAERGRLKARWRRAAIVAAAFGLVGMTLMALSWPISVELPMAPDFAAVLETASAFLSAPLDAVAGSAEAALAWESSLAEGIEIAFLVGVLFLMLGSVGGLARLLRHSGSPNGYSV
jgi:hypothetical protein